MNEIRFTWDKDKDKSNQSKHDISFEEAMTVFNDDSHSQLTT